MTTIYSEGDVLWLPGGRKIVIVGDETPARKPTVSPKPLSLPTGPVWLARPIRVRQPEPEAPKRDDGGAALRAALARLEESMAQERLMQAFESGRTPGGPICFR